jgi:hypothetical protein
MILHSINMFSNNLSTAPLKMTHGLITWVLNISITE